ncbi:MAG: acetaldehyde dehydrogenase (acetylating) [Clostridia bacterium]
MIHDSDLLSVQEIRNLLTKAQTAQKQVATMKQDEIDRIVLSMAQAAREAAGRLAAMAVEETGFGNAVDKTTKNVFAAETVYESIKDVKSVGVVGRDEQKRVWEIAQPVGVIAGIVPSTNPTSTTIFKSLIAVKAGNAIVFSPHPSAARCTQETARLMQAAAERAGAPSGLISCIQQPTMKAVNELMTHRVTNLILATGGSAMVKAAYASGKPSYGVGPGNVPVYLHESADIPVAIRRIMQSKTFDNGTICASEQALVVDKAIKRKVVAECKRQGAYFLDDHEKKRVANVLVANGSLNPELVGKSPQSIAQIAGILVPPDARVLIAEEDGIGPDFAFSYEKLTPILAMYTVRDQQEADDVCMRLLQFGGLGHTMGIHAEAHDVIEAFSMEKPVSRIVVNAGTTFGGIGASTGITPSLTLGCGTAGNNISSDNISVHHLFHRKRVAFGIREVLTAPMEAVVSQAVTSVPAASTFSKDELKELIKSVLLELQA